MVDQVSEHFTRAEFACRCGCGMDTIDAVAVQLSEEVREIDGGHPITPSSGCRCAQHNANIGGSPNSQHLLSRAVDLPVRNPQAVYDELCRRYPNQFGFGVYSTFVHVDSRGGPAARWRG